MTRQNTLGTFIEERRADGDIVDKTKNTGLLPTAHLWYLSSF